LFCELFVHISLQIWDGRKYLQLIGASANHLFYGKRNDSEARSDREKLNEKLSSDLKINELNHALGWKVNLCQKVLSYFKSSNASKRDRKRKRNYTKNYSGLLKCIRDKNQHYQELPEDQKAHDVFGDEHNSDTYMRYFTERFPGLVPKTYMFLQGRKQLQDYRYLYEEYK
jgi:hypothetical protein